MIGGGVGGGGGGGGSDVCGEGQCTGDRALRVFGKYVILTPSHLRRPKLVHLASTGFSRGGPLCFGRCAGCAICAFARSGAVPQPRDRPRAEMRGSGALPWQCILSAVHLPMPEGQCSGMYVSRECRTPENQRPRLCRAPEGLHRKWIGAGVGGWGGFGTAVGSGVGLCRALRRGALPMSGPRPQPWTRRKPTTRPGHARPGQTERNGGRSDGRRAGHYTIISCRTGVTRQPRHRY